MGDFDIDPQGFWWNPDIDLANLKKFVKNNDGRLVSLDAFVTGGNLRFCAAWIANAGAAKATWDWDPDISPDTIGKKMTALPGRITCLTSYVLNGKRHYAAVWVKKTGSQFKNWWWHPDIDPDTLGKDLKTNVGRLVCLDAYSVGSEVRFAAAWIENTGSHARNWFWWNGLDEKGLGQKFDVFCCYPAEVRSYPIAGDQRLLAAVLYANPQAADPDGAALLAGSGNAVLTKVSADNLDTTDPAPLHQWMDIKFSLKNLTNSNAKVTLAELYAMESGGFIYADAVENALTGLFSGASPTIAAGATINGSGTREWGFGIAHYLLRWQAESGSTKQRGVATVPVLRAGSAAPPAITTPTPVYLALWTKPAELVPVWLAGKNKTWLSVGGQIVNLSGKTLRIAGFQVVLTIDGKVVVD